MSKKHNQKLITPEILRQAVIGSFQKLNPRYMMKNPVMFVVEVGCAITLVLSFFPNVFGDLAQSNLRTYNIIVCVILFITVLFANFAESVAEGRGKAQAASLKKTQKETKARLLKEDGTEAETQGENYIPGVYVKYGNIARFCKIDPVDADHPLVTEGDYILVLPKGTDGSVSQVRLYDEIIVSGQNLYDGKLL